MTENSLGAALPWIYVVPDPRILGLKSKVFIISKKIESFFQNKAAEQNKTKSRKSMFFQNSTAEQRETKNKKNMGVKSWGCQV